MALLLSLLGCGGGGGSSEAAPDAVTFSVQPVSQASVDGGSVTFSASVTGTGVRLQWQRSTDGGTTWLDIGGATAQTHTITAVTVSLNGQRFRVSATSGTTTVFSSAVTLSVTPPAAPTIVVQPAATNAVVGANASFAVTATGTSLSYQWQTSLDGVSYTDVTGATQATLTLSAVTLSDNGRRYRVRIGNGGGSIFSNPVQLAVTSPPVAPAVTTQPTAASVLVGQTATFTVVATGTPTLTYQWQSSSDNGATFTALSGATAASYSTPATQATDNGKRLRVVVGNAAGSVTSTAVLLTVAAGTAPVATSNPTARVAYLPNNDFVPSTASFSASFSGTPTPTLQWQVSTDGGRTFGNINGATGATYTTPAVSAADDNKQFRLVATNLVGTAATTGALLTVLNAGIGGEAIGLGIRSNGEIVAAVNPFAPAFTVPNWTIPDFFGVRIVSPAGRVTTLAGSSATGHVDGTGVAARFYLPRGLVLDASGNAYVTDLHAIRKVTPAGVVTTVAGVWNQPGFIDDSGALARFNSPTGITIDTAGNLYVVDTRNSAVRKITPAGAVTTVAGGTFGTNDGTGTAARFRFPLGITADAAGNLFVTDTITEGSVEGVGNNCRIRRITPAGAVTTLSGPACGSVNGPLASASFDLPWGIAADSLGNLFLADATVVRKISPQGVVSSLAGSTTGRRYVSNGAIAVDATGNVYVHSGHTAPGHTDDNLLLKIAPDGSSRLLP